MSLQYDSESGARQRFSSLNAIEDNIEVPVAAENTPKSEVDGSYDQEDQDPEQLNRWARLKKIYRNRSWSLYLSLRPYWIPFSVLFILFIVAISIGIGWALRLRQFQLADTTQLQDEVENPNAPGKVLLSANLIGIDEDAQTMTMDWNVGYSTCTNGNMTYCPDIYIYFDENLLRSADSSSNLVSNQFPDPIFFMNGTNQQTLTLGTDERPDTPVFRTEIAITNDGTGRTGQSYPFEEYNAEIFIFAQNSDNGNSSVPILIVQTSGLAVGFNAKLVPGESVQGNDQFKTLDEILVVTRGPVVRMYAIFIVITVWSITLTLVAVCVAVVIFGKAIATDVLVLPVATVFAFTQLRGTLPGAPPGFGADIDFVGILPCLALLTICSIFLTGVFLARAKPEEGTKRWQQTKSGTKDYVQGRRWQRGQNKFSRKLQHKGSHEG